MKRYKYIIRIAIALIAIYYFWWFFFSGDFFYTHGRNATNRTTVLKIRENIQLGDGYEQVLSTYWHNASPELRLNAGSPQSWSVSMPHEILTTDWVLYIGFADNRVSAMKIRNTDGLHPSDTPEDVGSKKKVGLK